MDGTSPTQETLLREERQAFYSAHRELVIANEKRELEERRRELERKHAKDESRRLRYKQMKLVYQQKAAMNVMKERLACNSTKLPKGRFPSIVASWQRLVQELLEGEMTFFKESATTIISKDSVNNQVKALRKRFNRSTPKTINEWEAVLKEEHELILRSDPACGIPKEPPPPLPEAVGLHSPQTVSDLSSPGESTNRDSISLSSSSRSIGGRPKGSRAVATVESEKKRDVDAAMNEAASAILQEQKALKKDGKRKRLDKGFINNVIRKAEANYNLTPGRVKPSSVKTRVRRKNPAATNDATTSPLAPIEPVLVEWCQRMGQLRIPLDKTAVMRLVSDLIRGTPHQKRLEDWRERHSRNTESNTGDARVLVSNTWFHNFMTRNKDKLKSVAATVKDDNRATWCTYANFEAMYNCIYDKLVEAGVAEKSSAPYPYDAEGYLLESADDTNLLGVPTRYRLTDPDWLLFVDETGANTNMKKDGRIGQKTYIVGQNQGETGRQGAANDIHFTTLVFQAATGDPVLCGVILKSNREFASDLPITTTLGFDVTKTVREGEGTSDTLLLNMEQGGAMQGGPTCTFRGKKLPCFVACSKNASITSEILTDMLAFIDKQNVYDRTRTSKRPFLILDGHHSRLELPFLQYINNPETEWRCCIGVPYGSHFWQVADSNECNGSFKTNIYKFKQSMYDCKPEGKRGFKDSDIIPIVNHAFDKSFGKIDSVKKAIAHRGWNPLNYCLLTAPDIAATKNKDRTESTDEQANTVTIGEGETTTASLNISTGTSATLFDELLWQEKRNEERLERIRKKKREKEAEFDGKNKLKSVGRITSSKLAAATHFSLDETVLEAVKERVDQKEQEEKDKQDKRDAVQQKLLEQYNVAKEREREGTQKLRLSDMRAIVRKERLNTDDYRSNMGKEALEQLYNTIVMRREDTQQQNDDDVGIESERDEDSTDG